MKVYKMRSNLKEAQRQADEEARKERVRKRTNPDHSSVDMIQDASIDLEGGEYVDYEDVKE